MEPWFKQKNSPQRVDIYWTPAGGIRLAVYLPVNSFTGREFSTSISAEELPQTLQALYADFFSIVSFWTDYTGMAFGEYHTKPQQPKGKISLSLFDLDL